MGWYTRIEFILTPSSFSHLPPPSLFLPTSLLPFGHLDPDTLFLTSFFLSRENSVLFLQTEERQWGRLGTLDYRETPSACTQVSTGIHLKRPKALYTSLNFLGNIQNSLPFVDKNRNQDREKRRAFCEVIRWVTSR